VALAPLPSRIPTEEGSPTLKKINIPLATKAFGQRVFFFGLFFWTSNCEALSEANKNK
jgi:hypothetical protein